MMASTLICITSFHMLTESKKDFLFPSLFPVLQHLTVALKELPVFSVFILIPAIPIVNSSFLLPFDDFLLFRHPLIWPEIIVVLGVSKQISGHLLTYYKGKKYIFLFKYKKINKITLKSLPVISWHPKFTWIQSLFVRLSWFPFVKRI